MEEPQHYAIKSWPNLLLQRLLPFFHCPYQLWACLQSTWIIPFLIFVHKTRPWMNKLIIHSLIVTFRTGIRLVLVTTADSDTDPSILVRIEDSLKLVDKFTNLRSSVSSTEKDINTRLAKAWTAIDRLSVIWKSDLTDKMKRSFFFQSAVVSILLYGCTTWTLQECCEQYWTSPGGSTPQNSSCTATDHPSQKLSKLDKLDKQDTAGEVGTNSLGTYSRGPLHMEEQRQDDQLEPTYNSSVPIQDVALKTNRERWTIERGGWKGSGISVLIVRHDEDERILIRI